jgi:hypothetical protein
VATEDFLLIIIKIATLLGVVEDLVTFTFEKVDGKSTQEQLTIKTDTLLGVDKVLEGARCGNRRHLICKIGGETQDWVIITELSQEGDIIDEVSGVGDTRDIMAGVELECSIPTCTLGPGVTKWRTSRVTSTGAVNMLRVHVRMKHSLTNKWVGEQFEKGQNIVDRESSEASIMTDVVLEEEREPVLDRKLTADSIVLECSNARCQLGPGGTRWSLFSW